jgi:2-methylcitrate dehydratase PrpD
MPFCAAAAVVFGRVGIDTFDTASLASPTVSSLMSRVAMHVDPSLDGAGPPLTQARVRIRLRDGRVLAREAHGARGYPARPAGDEELAAKFMACASRVMSEAAASTALQLLRGLDGVDDLRTLTAVLCAVTPSARGRASRS